MRLRLRPVTPADSDQIAAIYAHFVSETPVSFESAPPDSAEIAKRIDEIAGEFPWLVCDADGVVAGYAYACKHRPRYHYQWSVDVSVYVHDSFRRRGIGRSLYTALLAMLPLQGFVMAHAGITLPNEGSVGLHESVGFRLLGVYKDVGYKLGRWHDVGWWNLQLKEAGPNPDNPLPLPVVQGSRAWLDALQAGQELLDSDVR